MPPMQYSTSALQPRAISALNFPPYFFSGVPSSSAKSSLSEFICSECALPKPPGVILSQSFSVFVIFLVGVLGGSGADAVFLAGVVTGDIAGLWKGLLSS